MQEERMTGWAQRGVVGLRAAVGAMSVAAMLIFMLSAWHRLRFPYEFEWIEDGILASVRHVRAGLPLYAAPSANFTPYLYTPLYIYLAAACSRVTGINYATLRGLSTVSTLGSFALIYALVWKETRRHFAALAAAGMFAACYSVVDGSFDVGRVDMLWLLLLLAAIYATRRLHPLLAALLWVCAFQTKQGVLPIALLFLLHDWQRPRRILLGVVGFVAMLAVSIAWLTRATDGWYRYYVFGLAGGLGFDAGAIGQIIASDLFKVCGIALVMAVAAVMVSRPAWRGEESRRAVSFYVLGTLGMVGFVVYLRAHRGANTNVLIPMYAWMAVLFGVSLARICAVLEQRRWRWAESLVLLGAMAQIAQNCCGPNEFSASREEMAFRSQLEARLRQIPGDVLVVSHPEYGLAAGKTEYAGSESAGAVIEARDQKNGDRLMADYAALIHSGRLSAVVLDGPAESYLKLPRVWMPRDFMAKYPLVVVDAGGDAVRFTSQPKYIYLPCSLAIVARLLDARVDESKCAGR
jgi:hypothetical protein